MRVLVTGAAGFLGSHLAERFLLAGHTVVGVDSLVTGTGENVSLLEGYEKFTFVRADVRMEMAIDGALDGVLHLASRASPQDYLEAPVETLETGSAGTGNALALAAEKSARFLLASTSEVYGDPEVNPQPEEYWGSVNPVGLRGCYDEAKRYAEALTMAWHRTEGVDTRIARIFNMYGPRLRPHDGRVVSNFICQALAGEPMTIFGSGSQTRSLCYVSDGVEGIYRLFRADYNGPVNIGNPTEMTVREIADTVAELTGGYGEVSSLPLPQDDPRARCPDITLARRLLEWEPKVTLREGIRRTVEYFRERVASGRGSKARTGAATGLFAEAWGREPRTGAGEGRTGTQGGDGP